MFGFGLKATRADPAEDGDDGIRLGDEMRGERATLGKSLMDVQRELRIKASYIGAIESADISAFDSPSFVAGYVRSYARYLGMEPDAAFARFCRESGFRGIDALRPMGSGPRAKPRPMPVAGAAGDPSLGIANPFARRTGPGFEGFEPGALGSIAVLLLLAGGIGYGGWAVLREVQRVHVAPVDEAPILAAELDPLTPAPFPAEAEDAPAAPSPEALARLYRPRVLKAPVLVARDAPISTIAPGTLGALAGVAVEPEPTPEPSDPIRRAEVQGPPLPGASALSMAVDAVLTEAVGGDAVAGPPRVLADAPAEVVLIATREAWVRVRDADGATLIERILQPGDTWTVPAEAAAPTLRTGNSGGVYFAVGGATYGPVAPGAQVVSDVALGAEAVTTEMAAADLTGDVDIARVVAELALPPDAPAGD